MKKFWILTIVFLFPMLVIWQNLDILSDTDKNSTILAEENIQKTAEISNNNTISDNIITNNAEQNDINENWENTYGLWNIWFWFCNEWEDNISKSLNHAVSQWKAFDVCLMFYNNAPIEQKIKVRIVDQSVTAEWDSTCDYTSSQLKQFISESDLEDLDEIVLPSEEYVHKNFSITFPIWIEWDIKSCFSFYIPKENVNIEEWAGFSVINNDAYFMNFFVWDLSSIQNELLFENLSAQKDDNWELNLQFNLINTWNLENKVSIKWTITNIFWFHKEFTINWSWIQVKPGDTVPVSAVLWSLPSYGGLYKIEFTATATPFFSYDISNSTIDPTLLEPKEFTASTTFFQMPWLIIIIAIVVILLIISMFRKPKEKVVYVNNPQQPIQPQQYQQPVQPQQYQQPVQPQQYQQPIQPQQPTQNQQ